MARTPGFARIDVTGAINAIKAVESMADKATEDMQIELANIGVDKMKEFIETRGTGRNPWGYNKQAGGFVATPMRAKESPRRGSPRSGSSPGRVNTGNMRDSVAVRIESGVAKRFASFGWIRASGEDREYFQAQEYGFNAGGFRAPQNIPGMFALRDARAYVQNILPRVAKKYQKRIEGGYYK